MSINLSLLLYLLTTTTVTVAITITIILINSNNYKAFILYIRVSRCRGIDGSKDGLDKSKQACVQMFECRNVRNPAGISSSSKDAGLHITNQLRQNCQNLSRRKYHHRLIRTIHISYWLTMALSDSLVEKLIFVRSLRRMFQKSYKQSEANVCCFLFVLPLSFHWLSYFKVSRCIFHKHTHTGLSLIHI